MTPVTPGHPVSPDDSGIPCADGSASHGAMQAKPRLPHVLFARGKGFAALAALWLLCGCGGGLAFTGGSIPPGGTRLVGLVSAAENPREPLAGATVQVETHPVTGGVRTLTAISGTDGAFQFSSVPTGATTSNLTVTVTPAPPSDPTQVRLSQQIVFQAQNGVANDLVVALPLNTPLVNTAVSLTLNSIATGQVGDTTALHAHLFDGSGNKLNLEPTLLYSGNFGSIAPDETFTSKHAGSGSVTAFWYNLTSVTMPITVVTPDPNNPLPPAPPFVPDIPPFATTAGNSTPTH